MPTSITFLDLFAGAGGFSEGFLQASTPEADFRFLLASDINENCELTHQVRYNEQLDLGIAFLCKSIKDPDFVDLLLEKLTDPATGQVKQVDVVCGGPPCQSFSLAGRRRLHDKKDDLFAHYLKVIATLRPKYFIMENVTGILTKDDGKHRDRILRDIASIIDPDVMPHARQVAARAVAATTGADRVLAELIADGLGDLDQRTSTTLGVAVSRSLSSRFRAACAEHFTYKVSKTDADVLTVRHALAMLERRGELQALRDRITQFKGSCDLDRDHLVGDFDAFLSAIELEELIARAELSLDRLVKTSGGALGLVAVRAGLGLAVASTSELLDRLARATEGTAVGPAAQRLTVDARLYRIEEPLVLNAADYGVPQERRRVFFIGCRKGLPFIQAVPPTVRPEDRVTVFEALWDLDFVDNGDDARAYAPEADVRRPPTYEAHARLLRERDVDGRVRKGRLYSAWSRQGRIPAGEARYTARADGERQTGTLLNHQASHHNAKVEQRMRRMQEAGGWENVTREALAAEGLDSAKRDYSVLVPNAQSPTVMTIADDFVHYRVPRTLTVREMARLQSFDDSFVFQGKRTTGGDRRKDEVPQFTLVGNAVPPLLARALASTVRDALLSPATGTAETAGKKRRKG